MTEIAVDPKHLNAVRDILRKHVPDREVWAFGSRVHRENLKPFSDLDLAILGAAPLDLLRYAELRDSFSESSLPFRVDLVDWPTASEEFRRVIEQQHVVVQRAPSNG